MSALRLPTPTPTEVGATQPDRHLRLVEPPAPSLAPSGPVQAWRRRLGALVVLVALAVVLVQALVAAVDGPTSPAVVPVSAVTVVVEPGQTLWDIATEHAPSDVATRTYLNRVAELNGLQGGQVDAWQVLRLPAG